MPNKLIRNCIVCGAESGAEIFSYTFDFMVNVRGTPPDRLRAKGFGDEETSTIVKCSKCGCNYIKDVLVDFQTASAREHGEDVSEKKSLEERTRATTQTFSSKQISDHLRMSKIYEKATRHVRAAGESRTKVLDFGAGSARFSNLAKVIGADLVVSYDLGYGDDVQDVFDAAYTNGIVATNKIGVVEEHGPYHVIFCQSMIEHVTDPQAILCHLQQNLHDAGIVYINNPIMNIDKEISELRAATSIVKKSEHGKNGSTVGKPI